MQWFHNLFAKKAAPARPSVRPQLEALEERQLLNASVVFNAAGEKTTFVVFNNGNAFQFDKTGGKQIGSGVRVVNGFLDPKGNVGIDITYLNGQAFEFDSTGARTIGTANILDASRAYDKSGNFKWDILYADGKGFGTGNLVEYTNKGFSTLTTNAIFGTAYLDVNGVLGNAYGIFNSGNLNDSAFTFDSTGVKTLYNGSAFGDPVTDYSQVNNGTTAVVIDETFGFGGCLEFTATNSPITATGVVAIGNDNIQPF
jgi:hypothetical protein